MAKKTTESDSNKDLLVRIRRRFAIMVEADETNRKEASEDLRFALVPGSQWTTAQKEQRGDRPCYEFNKIRVTGKRIVNDMRANRPQGKVRATEDNDRDAAEALEGLARNIWQVSDGDTVIDYAGEHQVFGGYGAWRITVDYSSDTAFDQDIGVEALRNPFCLYADPAAKDPLKRDAADWIVTEKISKDAYKERWPNKKIVNFDDQAFEAEDEWEDEDRVRICEYWYKKPVSRSLLLLSDGQTITDEDLAEDKELQQALRAGLVQITRERPVRAHDIYMCIASGDAVLEGPTRWAGSQFPFVVVYGEWTVIDGKPQWHGITRFAKDPQRSYNVSSTAITETIQSAPQAKYWATPEQAKGHTGKWAEAHKKLFPFMLYNPDPKAPGPPQRMGGPEVPIALIQQAQMASEEIKAVTGIFDASLGNRSNEQTGVAIRARQAQGEIATYNYSDNMGKAIRRTWELFVDLAPKIYDTERVVRILGADGAEKYIKINGQDAATGKVVDITRGKFDVAVTVGPSFSTQRQEAAETYGQLIQGNPELFPIIGDLVLKATDLPYADQIAKRLKVMLPSQIQQLESEGKQLPPEAAAAMQQASQAMQMVDEKAQLLQQAEQELKTLQSQAKGDAASAKLAQANLAVAEAQFEARLGEFESAQKDLQRAREQLDADRELFARDVQIGKLEIKLAQREAATQVMQAEHSLETGVMQAQHDLTEQAHQNDMQITTAVHQQDVRDARSQSE